MKKIALFASLVLTIFLTSSFSTTEVAPAPSYKMYSFLKESQGFRVAIKGITDELAQNFLKQISPSTTDPTEIAMLKFAKALVADNSSGKAFSFVINGLVTSTYISDLNQYEKIIDDFAIAFNSEFQNLALDWAIN